MTFTKTLATFAPTAPDVYVRVLVRANATPVVARAVMAAHAATVTVGTDQLWVKDVTWDSSWDNPIVVFDDGVLPWGEDESLVNVVKIEGAPVTSVDDVHEGMAVRIVDPQVGTKEIIKGDAYASTTTPSRPIVFTRASTSTWPTTLSGWTVTIHATNVSENNVSAAPASATWNKAMTVVDDNTVHLFLATSETDALATGTHNYKYTVLAVSGSNKWTLERGTITVNEEQVA